MSIGRPEHAATNRLLAERLRSARPLVVAHRGTAIGSISENTIAAAHAALASGADVVELDLTESADGDWFAFHDGTERRLLGIEENLRTLPAARVRELRYVHVDRPGRPAPVEPLLGVLGQLRGGARPLVNLDRSWRSWPRLLPALDRLGMTEQLLLKSPATLPEPLDALRTHPVKYPYLPICSHPEQVEELAGDPRLNVVGVELLADGPDHPFADPAYVASVRAGGLCVLVNAEVLNTDRPLFAGWDDELALAEGPAAGWGPLLELGADLVQTDWPWLLAAYRGRSTKDRLAPGGTP